MVIPESLIAVLVLQAGMIIFPGSDYALIMRTIGRQDAKAGAITAFGFGTGALGILLLSILGLNTLVIAVPVLGMVIRWLGAAWLMYQGVLCFFPHFAPKLVQGRGSFLAGVINHGLNIEMILFYIAVIGQLAASNISRALQVAAAFEMALFTIAWFVFISFVIGKIPKGERILNHLVTRVVNGVLFLLSAVLLIRAGQ